MRFGVTLGAALILFELLRETLDRWIEASTGGNPWIRFGASAALSTLVALGVAFVFSRWLGQRLARLSRADGDADPDELPGPFDDSGDDEIARAAATMNLLRASVDERRKALALQDLRRREWIAQVSHDLRTPLTAQLACLDRVLTMMQKADSELRRHDLREQLVVAKSDALRVLTLADDLLEIGRLDAGDDLQLEPVPPGELVRHAARNLEPLAEKSNIRLTVQVTARLPVLSADGRRLTRAIENLLRNAIQHAKSAIEVSAVQAGDHVRFEVRDDGEGLPKGSDFLGYLRRRSTDFPLSELARRRKNADSAGLGLIVAQRVAEAHNGKLDAYNNLTRTGATFVLDIPIPTEDPSLGAEDSAVHQG